MAHLSNRAVKKLEVASDAQALIGWLRADNLDIRSKRRIADALGRVGDPLAVDALLEACADQLAIHNVLGALAKIGDRRAVPGIVAFCSRWTRGRAEHGTPGMMNRLSVEVATIALRELLGPDVAAGIRDCDAATIGGWQRYHRKAWTQVESWAECPLCEESWAVRVEGAVQCSRCYRYFSNFDRRPHASDGSDGLPYGTLTGTSPWLLTLTEAWIKYNDEREADGLVTLPLAVAHLLTPLVESRVAWQFDETLMGGALRGGPDVPPRME